MLKLVAASFDLFLGTLLGAVGLPLALWVLVALYRAELARESALWALELSPLSHGTAVQLAGDLTQRNALIALGIAAAVLCAMAFAALRSARSELRPVGATTHGGKVRIELVTNPLRVGAPVAGSIWLSRRMEPDDAIRVGLSCKRIHGSGVDQTAEVAFSEVRDVAPVRTSHGWSAPFRFEVPAIAPPSGNGFDWRLAYTLSRRELPSLVALELGPAPEGAFRAIETQAALDARSSTLGTIGEPSVVSRQPSGSSEFRVPGSEERLGTPHSGLGTRHSGLRTQDSGTQNQPKAKKKRDGLTAALERPLIRPVTGGRRWKPRSRRLQDLVLEAGLQEERAHRGELALRPDQRVHHRLGLTHRAQRRLALGIAHLDFADPLVNV